MRASISTLLSNEIEVLNAQDSPNREFKMREMSPTTILAPTEEAETSSDTKGLAERLG